jgi:hypothetical protein
MVETGAFQPLNIGFILDEGTAAGASESVLPVHYAGDFDEDHDDYNDQIKSIYFLTINARFASYLSL